MFRFRLFGFPVTVQPFFWVILALLGGVVTANTPPEIKRLLIWIGVGFVSILAHELGHAIFMRRFGASSIRIELNGMGGLAISHARFTRRQQIIVSLAGPAFGLALGLLALPFYLQTHSDLGVSPWFYYAFDGYYFYHALWITVFLNFAWTALNLLPVLPLDGGHVAQAIIGPRNPRLLLMIGGVTSVVAAVVLFAYFKQPVAGVLFGFFAWQHFQTMGKLPR